MFLHWTANADNSREFNIVNWQTNNVVGVPAYDNGDLLGFNSVAYGNGIFVAVGDHKPTVQNGIIYTSTNGIDWTARDSGQDYAIGSVVFANGIFLATLYNKVLNDVLRSSDGITWTLAGIDVTNPLGQTDLNLAYANGRWISVTGTAPNSSWTSTDGVTWSLYQSDTGPFKYLFGAGSRFVGLRTNGSGQYVPYTSTDGASWTERTLSPAAGFQLTTGAYNGTYIVIASDTNGKPYRSTNGTTWTEATTGAGQYQNMVWTGIRFFSALSTSNTAESIDQGVNWTSNTLTPIAGVDITGIAVGSDIVVCVGSNGLIATLSI